MQQEEFETRLRCNAIQEKQAKPYTEEELDLQWRSYILSTEIYG